MSDEPNTPRSSSPPQADVETLVETVRTWLSWVPPDHAQQALAALGALAARLAETEARLRLANEEIRVREESQIPMIPRAANERLKAAERQVAELEARITATQRYVELQVEMEHAGDEPDGIRLRLLRSILDSLAALAPAPSQPAQPEEAER